jgi:small subunit ribosomal protein S16
LPVRTDRRDEKYVAVKLRLMRMGKKKQPTYRVVAADGRAPRDGRFIEILGHYDPRREPSAISIDTSKVDQWIARGAQPTDRVRKLIDVARSQPAAPAAVEPSATAAETTAP